MVQRAVNYLFGFYEKYLIPCAHIFNQTARRIDCNSLHIQFGTFSCILVVVPSLSLVWLFATLWTVAHQVSLSFIISRNLFKLMSMEAVMPSNHLVLCRPLLLPAVFPNIRFFSNESVLHIRYQSIGASALVLPMNIQDWFPLGLTVWPPCSPRDSQESSPALEVQHNLKASILGFSAFFMIQLSHP